MNNYGMFYRQVGCPKVIPKKSPGDLATSMRMRLEIWLQTQTEDARQLCWSSQIGWENMGKPYM